MEGEAEGHPQSQQENCVNPNIPVLSLHRRGGLRSTVLEAFATKSVDYGPEAFESLRGVPGMQNFGFCPRPLESDPAF